MIVYLEASKSIDLFFSSFLEITFSNFRLSKCLRYDKILRIFVEQFQICKLSESVYEYQRMQPQKLMNSGNDLDRLLKSNQ